MLNAVGHEN